MSWRPGNWEEIKDRLVVYYEEQKAFERGADTMLEALRDVGGRDVISTTKKHFGVLGKWVFIPDDGMTTKK